MVAERRSAVKQVPRGTSERPHPFLAEHRQPWLDGFVVGLLFGEGSFTGDAKRPAVSVRVHADSIAALQLARDATGWGTIYGPYRNAQSDGIKRGESVQWMIRSNQDLAELTWWLDQLGFEHIDARVGPRYVEWRDRWRRG